MDKKREKAESKKNAFFKQQYNIDKQILLAIYICFDNFILHFAAIYVDFCVLFSGGERAFFTLYIAFYTTQKDTQISLVKSCNRHKGKAIYMGTFTCVSQDFTYRGMLQYRSLSLSLQASQICYSLPSSSLSIRVFM